MGTPDYETLFATLGLAAQETADLGATLGLSAPDWRDTLRASLPRLPVGSSSESQLRLSSVLGKGGMGVVHLAYQTSLGRQVAVKMVHAERASREAENALLLEARVMGAVEHPNVVPVHEIGQDDDGRPVIVMKRVNGTAWSEYLDRKRPTPATDELAFHLDVFDAVCRAIAFAHDRLILHRDLKPENVMIGGFGEVYVLDWGLAVSLDPEAHYIPSVADANAVVGTPVYMAPEMTVGEGAGIGVHTDVFLLGAILYHIVTGDPPNRGRSLFDVLAFAYEGRPRPYADTVAAELRQICERAMAHAPADRFASVEALRSAVRGYLEHRNSHDLTATAAARLAELVALSTSDDTERVHRVFGEARFGYQLALQIWPENEAAAAGIQQALKTMIVYEVGKKNVHGARSLLAQLSAPDESLEAMIDELEKELSKHAAKLEKLRYDYDENVGIGAKRWVVGLMAVLFALGGFGSVLMRQVEVPEFVRAMGVVADPMVFWATVVPLSFLPLMVGFFIRTQRTLGDHKASRIFAKSLLVMYVMGYAARSSTLWADTPLHVAAATESAVYGAAVMILALAIDRRFGPAAFAFIFGTVAIAASPSYPQEVFSLVAVASCAGFLVLDGRLRRRRELRSGGKDG